MAKNGESSFGNNKLGWPYLQPNSLSHFVACIIQYKKYDFHAGRGGIFHRIANVGNIHQSNEKEMQEQ